MRLILIGTVMPSPALEGLESKGRSLWAGAINFLALAKSRRLATIACCLLFLNSVAAADTNNLPMTFNWGTSQSDARIVFADGAITPDTPDALLAFLARSGSDQSARIYFNSDGGDLQAGIDLGRLIRRLQFDTGVASPPSTVPSESGSGQEAVGDVGRCVSACALAFLGGVRREVASGSLYGVHQLQLSCLDARRSRERFPWLPVPGAVYCPEVDDAVASIQSANGALVDYVSEMGADTAYLSEMAQASPDGLNILSQSQMLAVGIVTPETSSQ